MPTVIDSLIVQLGLDPSGFTKGQKDAAQSFVKTRDEATRTAKEMEERGKQAGAFFSQLRAQVIELFAAFTAGKGLDEFISSVVKADASVGRLSRTLDTNVSTLSAWSNLGTLIGGSASDVVGSVQNLVSQFENFRLTGESTVIPYFRALGVSFEDASGKMRPFGAILLDLADKFHKLDDPARAAAFGKALGLDQTTINLLIQGRQAVEAMLAEQQRLGVITKQDAEAGIALQHAWGAVMQSSASLGRTLLTELTPYIVKVLDKLTDFAVWARQHGPFLQALFAGLSVAAIAFGIALLAPIAGILAWSAAIAGVITVLALLYDDWKTWTEGGKSEFGDFWKSVTEKWREYGPIVMDALNTAQAAFTAWLQTGRDGLLLLKALFFGTGDDIRKAWTTLFGDLGKEFNIFADAVKKSMPSILGAVQSAVESYLDWYEGRLNALWNAVFGHNLINNPHAASQAFDAQVQGAKQGLQIIGQAASAVAKGVGSVIGSVSGGVNSVRDAWHAAQQSQQKYGIPAEVTFAQYALESGFGKHLPPGSNNPFGIKAYGNEPFVAAKTREFDKKTGQMVTVIQHFRKFDSLADAFDAHARLLAKSSHYVEARKHEGDAKAFGNALTGIYATDPNYGAKLAKIIDQIPQLTAIKHSPLPSVGFSHALASAGISHSDHRSYSSSSDITIQNLTVSVPSGNPQDIAAALPAAIKRQTFAAQANFGQS